MKRSPFHLFWRLIGIIKTSGRFFQNFVAFSENPNFAKNTTTTKILLSGTKNTPVQNKLLHKSHSNCCQGTLLTGGVGLQLSSAVPQSKSFGYKSCSEQNLRFRLAGSTENLCNINFFWSFLLKYKIGVFIHFVKLSRNKKGLMTSQLPRFWCFLQLVAEKKTPKTGQLWRH